MPKIDREVADPIVALVVNKIIDRSEYGIDKYSVDLTRGDLSTYDWLNHLQEEMLDGSNYIEVLKGKIELISRMLANDNESNFEKVKKWNKLFDASKEPWLHMTLIIEEFKETLEAFGLKNVRVEFDGTSQEMDKVELLDGICDLIWVCYGFGWSMMWNIDEAFQEVYHSNMSKVWADGEVHKNEDGKIIKDPTTFSPPKLKKFVDEGDKLRFGDITGFKK